MEPRMEYATTSDGVGIAYWALGEGPTLVVPPPALPWSHALEEWDIPEWRHWYEHFTRHWRVVRYDARGSGLSERDVTDISEETELLDLDAVVNAVGTERVALFGIYFAGLPAMSYAARHPGRVSHLMLWCAFRRAEDVRPGVKSDALDKLMDLDWDLFTETMAHTVFGWSAGEQAHRLAQYMRAATDPAVVKRCWASHDASDLTDVLPQIACPTLVLHRRQLQLLPTSVARDLAAHITNARLAILEGDSFSPYLGEMEPVFAAIDDFIGTDTERRLSTHVHAPKTAGFRTILFTDMAESTAATQRLGDASAQKLVRIHNQAVRDALHSYGGAEVKHTGDGIMASFTSAVRAVECAIAIQRQIESAPAGGGDLSVRIGINAGEPLAEGDDLFGTAVQLASRICTRADPGTIMVSDVVRQLVAGQSFLFADRGAADLRGFDEPVRLFEVRWRGDA